MYGFLRCRESGFVGYNIKNFKRERSEAVEVGTVKLVGTNLNKIIQEAQNLLDNSTEYKKMDKTYNPYGDGNTC